MSLPQRQYRSQAVQQSHYGIVYPQVSAQVTESYLYSQWAKSKFKKHMSRFSYMLHGFIILAIVFGLLQSARTIVSGIYKLGILMNSQIAISNYHDESAQESRSLKDQIAIYSSAAGIEELARNNLEMIGQDEVLVRLR